MTEHDDLFAGFAVLEPSAEESSQAVSRTRAALLATIVERNGASQTVSVRSTHQPAERRSINDKAPSRRATRVSYVALATVASMLLMLVTVTMFNSRSALAWSDVVQQMVGARSLHCVVEVQTTDGKWVPSWEMKYEHQRGFSERHYDQQGLARAEFDNGESHWVHRRGQKVASRQSTLSAADQLSKLFNPVTTSSSFLPEPARDEVIDGTSCRCLTAIDEPDQSRATVWIDENKRLRRALIDRRIDGKWAAWCRAHVTYDVEIDAAAFEPRFDESIKIVDLSKLFEEVCPLDKAVHREEQFGYIFAIHELKRLGDFEYYMLVSFRPTGETQKKLALQQGEAAGQLFPSIRATVTQPVEQESGYPLAKARANGMEVCGYIVELRGFDLPPMKRARPLFKLTTHAKLWKEFGSHHDLLFDVPLPDKTTPKEETVRSLYDTIATLEAVPMDELFLIDPSDDRQFVDSESKRGAIQKTVRKQKPKPSETSFETFYEHLQKRYLESRPKTTVTPESSR